MKSISVDRQTTKLICQFDELYFLFGTCWAFWKGKGATGTMLFVKRTESNILIALIETGYLNIHHNELNLFWIIRAITGKIMRHFNLLSSFSNIIRIQLDGCVCVYSSLVLPAACCCCCCKNNNVQTQLLYQSKVLFAIFRSLNPNL